MDAATSHFVSISAIAAQLQTQLQQVKLADGATAAFEQIELFDSENLTEAFQLLLLNAKRLAIIVPLDEHWESPSERSNYLRLHRTIPMVVIVCDRVLGNRRDALYGNGTTPGAYGLEALALPFITGQLLDNPAGVVSKPVNSTILIVKNKTDKQNLPGRSALAIELQCQGGWMETYLSAGPSL
jgi:hypothetical protein